MDVFSNAIVLSRYGGGGTTLRRVIDASEAARLFAPDPVRTDAGGKGGGVWLPVEPGVVAVRPGRDGRHVVLVARKPGKAVIHVMRDKAAPEAVPCRLPGLLLEIVCHTAWCPSTPAAAGAAVAHAEKGGRYVEFGRVFAWFPRRGGVDAPAGADPLYTFPLPNGYKTGRICQGSVRIDTPAAADLSPSQIVEAAFLRDCLHTDRTATESLSASGVKRHGTVLRALRGTLGRQGKPGRPIGPEDLRFLTTMADLLAEGRQRKSAGKGRVGR